MLRSYAVCFIDVIENHINDDEIYFDGVFYTQKWTVFLIFLPKMKMRRKKYT